MPRSLGRSSGWAEWCRCPGPRPGLGLPRGRRTGPAQEEKGGSRRGGPVVGFWESLHRASLGTVYLSVHFTSPRAVRLVQCGRCIRLIRFYMLHIHDTLTRQKMPLRTAQQGVVRMYVCGMTVYDFCHLGHARMLVGFDVVQRWLRASGYQVQYVRNITDIDDKIIRRAVERGMTIRDL